MLREVRNARQIQGDPPRRWFSDDYFDLIVWFDADGSFWGFQLCYDKELSPRALTWTKVKGYTHSGIDDGEGHGGTHKSSPILVQDGSFDPGTAVERLTAARGELPSDIFAFVIKKIDEFRVGI